MSRSLLYTLLDMDFCTHGKICGGLVLATLTPLQAPRRIALLEALYLPRAKKLAPRHN